MSSTVFIRDVEEDDLNVLFEQERDPIANRMAAYPSKDKEAFLSHWRNRMRDGKVSYLKTIVCNDFVAGSVECWEQNGKWLVGYWIGREYWGQGIATSALREALSDVKIRPLYAYVGKHNKASIRVLEKCGFIFFEHGTFFSEVHGHDIEESIFIRN
jgi:RimJ/RimL family protein N-acetyltransferase